jgi:tetratricopeptide (TPR) repeat protein
MVQSSDSSGVPAAPKGADLVEWLQQGVLLHQQGKLAQAQVLYERVLAVQPGHFDCLHMLGVIAAQRRNFELALEWLRKALQIRPADPEVCNNLGNVFKGLGRFKDALDAYDLAITRIPDWADAHNNRGLLLQGLGRLDEALASYEKVIALKPGLVGAHYNRGVALKGLGHLDAAIASYDRAIALSPHHAGAHYNRGNVMHEQGRFEQALLSYDKAMAIKPDYPEACSNKGNALKSLGRFQEALLSYDQAIALRPDFVDAHNNRGIVLQELRRFDEAIASFDRVIALNPSDPDAYNNHGVVLQKLRRFDEAGASYDRAIALRPDHVDALNNWGVALQELSRLDEALASYDKALDIKPDYADAHYNRGIVLKELGRADAALASYDRAIAFKQDHVNAHRNKALVLLLLGDFDNGWPLYEWRWRTGEINVYVRDVPAPLWLGVEPIAGKTILLHAEQGLGDTIQFCRYARLMQAQGAKVLLEVPVALKALLQGLEGVDVLISRGEERPAFDFHCPLMSLPLAFRTRLETIPTPAPYLASDPERRRTWEARLGPRRRPRVGLVWSGNPEHKNDQHRSLALAQVLQHLPAGLEYVSLQKEVRDADRTVLEASAVRDCSRELGDFADTAALCDLMDQVISVDTSVAHLSGALGKPTWILLPYAPDWRWLLDRDDSPWYGSVRLFRQSQDRGWGPVLQRVGQALTPYLANAFNASLIPSLTPTPAPRPLTA